MQQPVIVNGASQLVGMVPAWANVYVFASASFTAGAPILNSPCSAIYSRENGTLELITVNQNFKSAYINGNWIPWFTSVVTVPTQSGATLTGLLRAINSYPMHAEIVDCVFDTPSHEDNPNNDLGYHWYLDITAVSADNVTVTATGYGKTYTNTYDGAYWSTWYDSDKSAGYYVETAAKTEFTPGQFYNWCMTNVEDPQHRLYTVEFLDVTCAKANSPVANNNTAHYHFTANKTSDGKFIIEALITSNGTTAYPVGTRFRAIYDSTFVTSGWTVIEKNEGVVENTTPITNTTRAQLYTIARTAANGRDTFTIIFDDVTFLSSENLPVLDHFHVTVVKTTDRAFMRASCRQLDDYREIVRKDNYEYINLLLYSSLLDGDWTKWTCVNNPYLSHARPWTTKNDVGSYSFQVSGVGPNNWDKDSEEYDYHLPSAKLIHKYIARVPSIATATDTDWQIPTCDAVTSYVDGAIDDALGDIETILAAINGGND